MTRLLLIVLVAMLAACGSDPTEQKEPDSDPGDDLLAAAFDECRAKNWLMVEIEGEWTCLPRAGGEEDCLKREWAEAYYFGDAWWACFENTPDAGAPCDDTRDCFGYCEPPPGAEEGETTLGTCSRRTAEVCSVAVHDGVVWPPVCA